MTDRTLSEFTAQLASASPAPGGGGAAALTGALAASLAAMAANVTAANPRYAERTDALATLAAACDAQRTALLTLIDADAAGFLPLQRAYAIPKTDPERAAALAVAARTACQAPLDMLAHCEQVALLLAAALEAASPPPALGRRVCGGPVPRSGGGRGHERFCQHRPARARRPRRDRGARRAPARNRGAVLRADRGGGACRAARGGLIHGEHPDRNARRRGNLCAGA